MRVAGTRASHRMHLVRAIVKKIPLQRFLAALVAELTAATESPLLARISHRMLPIARRRFDFTKDFLKARNTGRIAN